MGVKPKSPIPSNHARSVPLFRALLRFPLFYKILIANATIVILGAVGGTVVTANVARAAPERSILELVVVFVLFGLALSVLANAIILRLALSPLKLLEATAERIRGGDLEARVPVSALADPALERLTRVFNRMLDGVAAYRSRLREIAARALRAEEEERKRIARELHDETLQTLAALLIRLRVAAGPSDSERREELVEDLREQVADAAESIRRIARGLRPPALDELGVVAAIEAHARAVADKANLSIEIDAEPLDGLLPPERELALYRILQEAISNVVRHAEATRAWIRIRHESGTVVAVVEDDGSGFPASEVMAGSSRGLGVFGMVERAAYIGGRVAIESSPGAGARVRVEVPIQGQNQLG